LGIGPRSGNKRKGDRGEDIALRHLTALGYSLVERNYRTRYGEIDLVMRDAGTLVFVEVKLRGGRGYGDPVEAVTERKQRAVREMAEQYLADREPEFEEARFDVVGVLTSSGEVGIQHIQDAF
jgi:putative endonuclease